MPTMLLGCPEGVIAGQNISVYAECDGGEISNVQLSGPYSNYVTVGDTLVVATQAVANGGGIGALTFTVTCTDEDGGTDTATCTVNIFSEEDEFICESSEPVKVTVKSCGVVCTELKVSICVSQCEPDCEEGFITGTSKECDPQVEPPNKEKPVPLTQQFLTGSKQAFSFGSDFLDDCPCDDQQIECFTHRPSICWNNFCACPGVSTVGPGLFNTTAENACCGSGKPWIFEGNGLMEAVGTQTQLVSCAIIWGHNIAQGTIETDPPIYTDPNDPNAQPIRNVGLYSDDACVGGFTKPIVMNLEATEVDAVAMAINGTTVDGGPIRINKIFMGNKFFLEDDFLPDGFVNPHNGSDFYIKTKKNECGYIISREVVRQEKTLSFTLDCLSERWLKERWRSYMRYLESGAEVYWQWSRNGCPDDIFMGYMTSANPGSTYDGPYQSLTFSAEGFCSQPQAKRLV